MSSTTQPLFDAHGRRVVPDGLDAKLTTTPDMNYYLGYHNSFRLSSYSQQTRLVLPGLEFLPDKEFVAKIAALAGRINEDEAIAGAFNGVCLPLNIPRLRFKDMGDLLHQTLIPALGTVYQARFKKRGWTDYRKDDAPGFVTVVDPHHQRMLDAASSEPLAAIIAFPFLGYAVEGQRKQMESLPQSTCNISLGGAIDISLAAITYVEQMLRDASTPGYDMSAVQWRSAADSLRLWAYGGRAYFGHEGSLDYAVGHYSGGLLFW